MQFTFTHSEEKIVSYEIQIEADDYGEAVGKFHEMRDNGEFFAQAELTYEGVSDSWGDTVEYEQDGETIEEEL